MITCHELCACDTAAAQDEIRQFRYEKISFLRTKSYQTEEETHTFLNEASAHEKGEYDCIVRLEAWDSDSVNAKRANG
jgi:hypothetical protein